MYIIGKEKRQIGIIQGKSDLVYKLNEKFRICPLDFWLGDFMMKISNIHIERICNSFVNKGFENNVKLAWGKFQMMVLS